MTLTCVAVDDEYLALQVIREYCKRLPSLSLVAAFTDSTKALTHLSSAPPDLIFLDIQMPFRDGFEVMKALSPRPLIILTTARHDQAVKAYELDVLDYLVKPISFERFSSSVQRAIERKSSISNSSTPNSESVLHIRSDHRQHRIAFDHIDLIEGLGEYVKIHTQGKVLVTLGPMKELLDQLPSDRFQQIHKSYIVRVGAIASFSLSSVFVVGRQLPVGRAYREAFKSKLERE